MDALDALDEDADAFYFHFGRFQSGCHGHDSPGRGLIFQIWKDGHIAQIDQFTNVVRKYLLYKKNSSAVLGLDRLLALGHAENRRQWHSAHILLTSR
jgi:hypothetical protein